MTIRKLAKFSVTNAGDEYVVYVEDDAGLVMEVSATREQIVLMDPIQHVPTIAGQNIRSLIEDAETAVERATNAKDVSVLRNLLSPDVLINSPANNVIGRDQMLAMTLKGEMKYSDYLRTTDVIALYGSGIAAVMGEERFTHAESAFGDGKIVRRYTDVWKNNGTSWNLIIRQATYTTNEKWSE